MDTQIVTALIGLFGVIVTAYIGVRGSRSANRALQLANREMKSEAEALDLSRFLIGWNGLHEDLGNLMASTPIDRFLILRAWNGVDKPRWTTALFQLRGGRQKPVNYIHVDLDADYVDKLSRAITHGEVQVSVVDGDISLISQIYRTEGVKSSVWFHIVSTHGSDKSKAITYCSFASHTETVLPEGVVTKCRIVASRLRGIAAGFSGADD